MPIAPKKSRESKMISTASLPDIVFMLLFFFMVTTVMRESELLVDVQQPEATQVVKLENRSMIDYIYVGTPLRSEMGTNPRIQLNGQIANVEDIQNWKRLRITERGESQQSKVITALKVDKDAQMGLVGDIKLELRKVDALKICYSTTEAMLAVQ